MRADLVAILLSMTCWALAGCVSAERPSPPPDTAEHARARSADTVESAPTAGRSGGLPADEAPAPPSPRAGGNPFARAGRLLELCREASAALEAGELDAALDLVEAALRLRPNEPRAVELKSRALRAQGRFDEALEAVRSARAVNPKEFGLLREEVLVLDAQGDADGALDALGRGSVAAARPAESSFLEARLHALREDSEHTLKALRRALRYGFSRPERVKAERRFDFLAADARYAELLEDMEEYAELVELHGGREPGIPIVAPPENTESYPPGALREELRYQMSRPDGGRHLAIDAVTLEGEPFRTEDLRDKHLVIVSWAHWSEVCARLLPDIARLEKLFRDRDVIVALAAVDLYGQGESFRTYTEKWLSENGIDLPCVVMTRSEAKGALGAASCPLTHFAGPEGKSYMYAPGPVDLETLESLVEILIEPRESSAAPAPGRSSGAGEKGGR